MISIKDLCIKLMAVGFLGVFARRNSSVHVVREFCEDKNNDKITSQGLYAEVFINPDREELANSA